MLKNERKWTLKRIFLELLEGLLLGVGFGCVFKYVLG